MAEADEPRYLIRTSEGDRGPFSARDIVAFLDEGRLKPNVRVLDHRTDSAVLVAVIARSIESGKPVPTAPPPTLPDPVAPPAPPVRAAPAAGATAPARPATSSKLKASSDVVQQQRDRTTAAFSKNDLAVEIAGADMLDIPAEVFDRPPSQRPGSGTHASGGQRRLGSGERHGSVGSGPQGRRSSGEQYDRIRDRGTKRISGRPARQRSERQAASSRRLRSNRDGADEFDDEFDDELPEERPRRSRKQQQQLTMTLVGTGVVLVLGILGFLVWQFKPELPYADLTRLPGTWTVDNEAMIQNDKKIDQFSFGMFEISPGADRLTTCNGRTYEMRAQVRSPEEMTLNLSRPEGAPYPNAAGSAYLIGQRLWLTMPLPGFSNKQLILRRGPPPIDPAAEMARIRARVDPGKYNIYTAGMGPPVVE